MSVQKVNKRYFVYLDWTLEVVPRVFYVGKGIEARTLNLVRNQVHTNIAQKHGLRREVIMGTTDERFALLLEELLVEKHKTYMHGGEGWWGANLTLGGDNSPMKDPIVATKVSQSKMGHLTSEETRRKIGESVRKAQALPGVQAKMKAASLHRHHSPETKAKMSLTHQHRTPISEETRQLMCESAKKREVTKRSSGFVYHKHTDAVKQVMREKALRWRALRRFHRQAHLWFTRSSTPVRG